MRSNEFLLVGLGLVILSSPFCRLALSQEYNEAGILEDVRPSVSVIEPVSDSKISISDSSLVSDERDYIIYDQSSKSSNNLDPYTDTNAKLDVFEDGGPGDILGKLQLLQQEIMRLNGVLEKQAHDIRILEEKSLQRYVEVDRRLSAINLDKTDSSNNQVETAFFSDQSLVPEQAGEGVAYRSAYGLVKDREFDSAINAFQNFLSEFPDGKFTPNAHFWLGELYLVLDDADPEASRQAFMLLVTQFPQHEKVPSALLKLGKIQLMKGNRERSRHYLN